MPIVWARSRCSNCETKLSPVTLVPIFSWLLLRGRCRDCRAGIPRSYLYGELGALVVAAWAALVVPPELLVISAILGWTLLGLAIMDLRYFLLSDVMTAGLSLIGLAASFYWSSYAWTDHFLGFLIGGLGLFLVNVAYRYVRGENGMGMGDVKLFAAAGAWLTWRGLPTALVLGCALALAVTLLQWRSVSRLERNLEVPFGAYLCFGFWATWLYGPIVVLE